MKLIRTIWLLRLLFAGVFVWSNIRYALGEANDEDSDENVSNLTDFEESTTQEHHTTGHEGIFEPSLSEGVNSSTIETNKTDSAEATNGTTSVEQVREADPPQDVMNSTAETNAAIKGLEVERGSLSSNEATNDSINLGHKSMDANPPKGAVDSTTVGIHETIKQSEFERDALLEQMNSIAETNATIKGLEVERGSLSSNEATNDSINLGHKSMDANPPKGAVDSTTEDIHTKIKQLEFERDALRKENQELRNQLDSWQNDKEEYKRFMAKNVMADPLVKLYSGENYTGDVEEYDFGAADAAGVTCQNMWYWRISVKSVETLGKCIRLFRYYSCEGRSLAIYPGSGNSQHVLDFNLRQVRSIGRCLDNELQFDTEKEIYTKNSSDFRNYVPDLVEFYSWDKFLMQIPVSKGTTLVSNGTNSVSNGTTLVSNGTTLVSNGTTSVEGYTIGPNQRIEFIHAWIDPQHLNLSQPKTNMNESQHYKALKKELGDGDALGYAIPPTIGGPSDQAYNTFPQTASGRREWLRIISGVRQFVKQYNSPVRVALNFQYQTNSTSRPYSFYYYLEYRYGSFKHAYGRILN